MQKAVRIHCTCSNLLFCCVYTSIGSYMCIFVGVHSTPPLLEEHSHMHHHTCKPHKEMCTFEGWTARHTHTHMCVQDRLSHHRGVAPLAFPALLELQPPNHTHTTLSLSLLPCQLLGDCPATLSAAHRS